MDEVSFVIQKFNTWLQQNDTLPGFIMLKIRNAQSERDIYK